MPALVPALAAALLLSPPVRAQDPPEEDPPPQEAAQVEGWTRIDDAGPWRLQPILPKAETDGTAHTLGQGRWRLGLMKQSVGVLDNVDLHTNLAVFLLGFPNAGAKVTAIQTDPVDISFQAGATWMDLGPALQVEDASGALIPLRWTGTWTAVEGLSLHLGNTWNIFQLQGAFDTEDLVAGLGAATGTEIDPEVLASLSELDEDSEVFAGANLLLTQSHLGIDYRFNRRDALLLRVTGMVALSGTVRGGFAATDDQSGAETEIGTSARIHLPLKDQTSVLATLSWQWSWEHLHLRVGVPIPIGSTWFFGLPQAFSLHWVMGGRKR